MKTFLIFILFLIGCSGHTDEEILKSVKNIENNSNSKKVFICKKLKRNNTPSPSLSGADPADEIGEEDDEYEDVVLVCHPAPNLIEPPNNDNDDIYGPHVEE